MTNYRAHGKQIMRGTEHVADAADTTWAQIIADALNGEREHTGGHIILRDAPAYMLGESGPERAMPYSVFGMPIRIDPCLAKGEVEFRQSDGRVFKALFDTEFRGEGMPHNVAARPDGSRYCSCGRQWDRDEGDECPAATR